MLERTLNLDYSENNTVAIYEAVVNLVDELDTHRIREAMLALEWKWIIDPFLPAATPTEAQLRKEARRLMLDATTAACKSARALGNKCNQPYMAARGGLVAEANAFDDGFVSMGVRFELCGVDNYEMGE